MKKTHFIVAALLVTTSAVIIGTGFTNVALTKPGQTLPASLDNYYPPKAQGPAYLMAMQKLNMPLAGLVCDLFENDMDNVFMNFDRFKAEYSRVAGMVPEWAEMYPEAPLTGLEAALKSGDQGKVMGALDQIDGVCHGCHVKYMPAVQHRYHWGDFGTISVTDPVTGRDVPFKQFKLMMNTDMAGIGNDLEQNQIENAQKHAGDLASRYEAMTEICQICHDSEPKYFVDDDVRKTVQALLAAFDSNPVNGAEIGGLLQRIGGESCFRCHLVHIPGAYSKY